MIETDFHKWAQLKEAGTIPTQPATLQGQQQQQAQNPQQAQQQNPEMLQKQDVDSLFSTITQKMGNKPIDTKQITSIFDNYLKTRQQGMAPAQKVQNPQMLASQGMMNRAATGNPQGNVNAQAVQ